MNHPRSIQWSFRKQGWSWTDHLNNGCYILFSQWQNHIDEYMEQQQQPKVVLQLGRGRGASQLLVRAAGRPEQQGVWGGSVAGCQCRQERRCKWSPPAGKLGIFLQMAEAHRRTHISAAAAAFCCPAARPGQGFPLGCWARAAKRTKQQGMGGNASHRHR